ncbi:hypothetical protein FH972_023570 [Carpinus fangiana]|uniref:Brix domain-containing protein n=1 Tax=Carpinus fangiana TaxID=176857 RepID=A0A5N6KVJ5_9ROSI|nr:hypothetical protein FH972_023570 [Carpinus fangiana]
MPPAFSSGGMAPIPFKSKNKDKRHSQYLKVKKTKESEKRDMRFKRKREEDKNPQLRAARLAANVPQTIEHKRVWDEVDADENDALGLSVDIERLKRPRLEDGDAQTKDGLTESKLKQAERQQDGDDEGNSSDDDDLGSLMDDSEDAEDEDGDGSENDDSKPSGKSKAEKRASSPTLSAASTNVSLIPDALAAKFPTLFSPLEMPKVLITTSLGGTVHAQAEILTELFPNSHYVPRQRHRYRSHHFSLREISKFAANRKYTTLVVLAEDQKKPSGLTVIHLPEGPTFHFSISNWVEGKKLPGHGNPTEHYPELILNNFRTPLGLLTAHLFRTIFPPQPEIVGRQVVTLHNQRDYIFVRRHRYIFRDKRATEKPAAGADGKPMKGVEDVKAGLQELGPRFTLKLRRIDKGIQRASGQEWEWKGAMEKVRTKFQL